ncbi:MAG: RNA pyrophosphohydrolase [Gammaproteobacteria bacterium]|nr:RNA pyrophosphohydrolase [Gammaproteobacteria bacterium]HEX5636026.1 RNA pyrophosphohydrolase [Gammaproteobacteria bacterium]
MIDSDGYRPNVGIILSNPSGQVFWARRVGQDAWQFPQGGIRHHETPDQAMYRELFEETGLRPEHVEVLGQTQRWLRYRLPKHMVRKNTRPVCIGQKQIWYVLRLTGSEADFKLDTMDKPEFDSWRWVDYWRPMHEVVFFKRSVYEKALRELEPVLFGVE